MIRGIVLLLHIVLLLSGSISAYGCVNSVYVSSVNGSDITGVGTSHSPYATITHVLQTPSLLCANANVFVLSGEYLFNSSDVITDLNAISIISVDGPSNTFIGGRVFIFGGSSIWRGFSAKQFFAFSLNFTDVVIQDFVFDGVTGDDVILANASVPIITTISSSLYVANSIFINNNCSIDTMHSTIHLSDSDFSNSNGRGVIVGTNTDVVVERCGFTNNQLTITESYAACTDPISYGGFPRKLCGGSVFRLVNTSMSIVDTTFTHNTIYYEAMDFGNLILIYGGALLLNEVTRLDINGSRFSGHSITATEGTYIDCSGGIMYIKFALVGGETGLIFNSTFSENYVGTALAPQLHLMSPDNMFSVLPTAVVTIMDSLFELSDITFLQPTFLQELNIRNCTFRDGISAHTTGVSINSECPTYVYDSKFLNMERISFSYTALTPLYMDNVIFDGCGKQLDSYTYFDSYSLNFTVKNSVFRNNNGIVYVDRADMAEFTNSSFYDNVGVSIGGAMWVGYARWAVFTSCYFGNNRIVGQAGAIYLDNIMNEAHFIDCVFEHNTAGTSGGAVQMVSELFDPTYFYFTNSIFKSNHAQRGGAVALQSETSLASSVFINCTFDDNEATQTGGAIYAFGVTFSVMDSNFSRNKALSTGGSISTLAPLATVEFLSFIKKTTFFDSAATSTDSLGGAVYAALAGSDTDIHLHVIDIEDVEFIRCKAAGGGAIGLQSSTGKNVDYVGKIDMNRVVFEQCNSSLSGGALYMSQFTNGTLRNSIIRGGYSENEGAAISVLSARLDISDCEIYDCTAVFEGGAIILAGTATSVDFGFVKSTIFRNNTSLLGSGGVFAIAMTATSKYIISNSTFEQNAAGSSGGALWLSTYTRIVIENSDFVQNIADQGGAIYTDVLAGPFIKNSNFYNNTALYGGGAVAAESRSTPSFVNSSFQYNYGSDGGAVTSLSSSASTFVNCSFIANESPYGRGGGVYATSRVAGFPVFNNCSWKANSALNGGGFASSLTSSAVFNNCEFSENKGTLGGAIHTTGTSRVMAVNTTFVGNIGDDGGALYCDSSANAVLTGCALMENQGRRGGGVCALGECIPMIRNSTIKGNNAVVMGGGVYISGTFGAIEYTDFSTNNAEYGGGVYFASGLPTTNAINSFNRNSFRFCGAIGAGGGYFWDYVPTFTISGQAFRNDLLYLAPNCTDCSFANNTAVYGPNKATVAMKQVFVDIPTEHYFINNQFGPITIYTEDFYGQTTTTTSGTSLSSRVTLSSTEPGVIYGVTSAIAVDGVIYYDSISMNGVFDATYDLTFYLEGRLIGGSAEPLTVQVTYRGCTVGQEQYSLSLNTVEYDLCRSCTGGYYNLNGNGTCLACPANAGCSGGAVEPNPDFYVYSTENGVATTYNCPPGFCRGDDGCGEHRSGLLCGTCAEGYQNSFGRCVECSGAYDPASLFGTIALLWAYVAVLLYTSQLPPAIHISASVDRYAISGLTKIILFFVQTVTLVTTPSESIRRVFSFLNFQFFLGFANKCTLKLDFFTSFLLSIVIPLILVVILGITYLLQHGVYRASKSLFNTDYSILKVNNTTYIRTICAMILFSYSQVTEAVFSFLNCRDVGPYRVVSSAPSVYCTSNEYKNWSALAYILLFGYVVLLPVALFVGLFYTKHHKKLLNPLYQEKIGIFFQCFRTKHFYWEVVIIIRRLIFIAIYTVAYSTMQARYMAIFIFCLLILVVQLIIMPFYSKIENIIESALLTLLVLLAGVQSSSAATIYTDEIIILTTILTFLAAIPVCVGLYKMLHNLLVQYGCISPQTSVTPLTAQNSSNNLLQNSVGVW